jgi:galactokinase
VTEERPWSTAELAGTVRGRYGSGGAVRVVRAPGRVNLIGEHTDYNLGLVMPAAIDLEVRMGSVASGDRRVELTRLDTGECLGFDVDSVTPDDAREDWIDYVAGVAWSLREAGVPLRGVRGVISSTVPPGAGLSSSAAIELASAWTLSADVPPPLPTLELALAAQRAENRYVGVQSGLMDQFASAFGRSGAALRLDCRSLESRPVALPGGHAIVVCDTRAPHVLDGSEYNVRRAQCEAGVAYFAARGLPVWSLRDVDLAMLQSARLELPDVVFRRCEHIVRENERVDAVERGLASGDLERVGRAFAESHASMRDLFEISTPELDAMVEIAIAVPGVEAARMTGGGFGGCTVNIVRSDAVDALRRAVESEYPQRTGVQPAVYVVTAAAGAGLLAE